jgi:hypothetical protein
MRFRFSTIDPATSTSWISTLYDIWFEHSKGVKKGYTRLQFPFTKGGSGIGQWLRTAAAVKASIGTVFFDTRLKVPPMPITK